MRKGVIDVIIDLMPSPRWVPLLLCLVLAVGLLSSCDAPCPGDQIHCGGVCVSLQSDPFHCGACAKACAAGGSCTGGACECPAGETICGSACTALQHDAKNCGTCGHACGLGTCNNGVCSCAASPATVQDCGGAPQCVDLGGDAKNCGACGRACTLANELCTGGVCACGGANSTACPEAAPTECVNTTGDPGNCGGCGDVCLNNGLCDGGACGCPASTKACPTNHPTSCVNEANDAMNCGACATVCAVGQTCQTGICCAKSVCGGKCLDTSIDPTNCGACGAVCPAAAPECVGSACCGAGTTAVCGTSCCGGGSTCCASGACQTQHYNGLGGPSGATFFDCYANDSVEAAADAALHWSPAGVQPTNQAALLAMKCVGWQTSDRTQCAVYCATGSSAPGLVRLTLNNVGCLIPFIGDPSSTSWQ